MGKFTRGFFIKIGIISVVVLLLMAFSTLLGGRADVVTNAVNMTVQPVMKGCNLVYHKISYVVDSLIHAGSYAEENEMLKARIARLESDYSEIEVYKSENERLTKLLGMKESLPDLNLQGAKVTGIESDNWYDVISIDKGTSSGVSINDIVLTDMGLIGTVVEVGTTWAKVREITDVDSSIGAVCARTGDRGVLEGDYNLSPYGRCRLRYLSKDANIVVGDRIEISGSGSIYPKGVYIGKIVEISDDEDGLTLSAIVESEVRFNSLSEVLVGR
ncbi:MAG: rod shape-determining protein MreC [Clostridia bacterium]